jgi:putative spermidine/putrescine transport system substrate-binding protein
MLPTRRKVLAMAGATATASTFAALGGARAQAREITIMVWGTTWQTALKELGEKFTAESGIVVKLETQTSAPEGLVKLQAARERPMVDVWFTTAAISARARADQQLFAEIPLDRLKNVGEVYQGAVSKWGVPFATFPIIAIIRTDLVTRPVNSWNDLWDPAFRNKLAIPNMTMYQGRFLLLSAALDGGGAHNIEPGFERLRRLRPNVALFYSSDQQARQALAQGEASVLFGPPSLARWLIDQKIPVSMLPLRPTPLEFDMMMMVRGPRQELALQYLDFMMRRDVNEWAAQRRLMMPSNMTAAAPDLLKGIPPTGSEALIFDDAVVNANIAAWTERFNQEIAR